MFGTLFRYIFSIGKYGLMFLVVISVIHGFIATLFLVDGESMAVTLQSGQWVMVDRLSYSLGQPNRGDIVIVKYPGDPEKRRFVKRVIGLPGETVLVKGGRVSINGQELTESYLRATIPIDRDIEQVQLGQGEYFVLGDNRPVSNDSRVFGAVPDRFVVGKVVAITYPLNNFQIVPKTFY